MTRLLPLFLGSLLLVACGGRGDAAFGDPCEGNDTCAEGLCIAGVDGNEPVCTKSCATSDECPEGWSCSGVTQARVLVCSHSPATPFGEGN